MSSLVVPAGFRLTGVHCGIKRDSNRPDLVLIAADGPSTAAGVYTTNQVCAAPVSLDRERTPSGDVRVVVANSGNANACTGERGMRDAMEMTRLAAAACGAQEDQTLVLSTGIIGEHLPMAKIARGIDRAADRLAASDEALLAAAGGLMTTDTVPKMAGRQFEVAGRPVCLTGLAKGSGMIGPNMATMLAVLLTDAALQPSDAQHVLSDVVGRTFNCISVEGHTSTNDSVLLLASGAGGGPPLSGEGLGTFRLQLLEMCVELARAIAADGEGATHLIEIDVRGCASSEDARRIAKAIADSPLVKTAIAGADPNWGRMVSAAGYAGVPFEPSQTSLRLNGTELFRHGTPVPFDAAAVSASIRDNRETKIMLQLGEGSSDAKFWSCDLTAEYVRINAEYHT